MTLVYIKFVLLILLLAFLGACIATFVEFIIDRKKPPKNRDD